VNALQVKSRWIEDIEEFKQIAGQWDEALEKSGSENPFLLSDFILTWWKHYRRASALRIFLLYDGDGITGGVPFVMGKNGYLVYVGGVWANYTEVLSTGDGGLVWDALLEALNVSKEWESVRLPRVRKSGLLDMSRMGRFANLSVRACFSDLSYLIKVPVDFSGYADTLPKKLRYHVRRSEKGFSLMGRLELTTREDCSGADKLFDRFVRMSRDSLKARNERSNFEDERVCVFFRDIVNTMCLAGYLCAHALELDGEPVAIHLGYCVGRNFNYVLPAFDIRYAELNPGHLLIYKLIELSAKRGNEYFDMYSGGSLYKRQWSDVRQEVFTVEIWRNTFANSIRKKLHYGLSAAKQAVKNNRKAYDLVKRLKKKSAWISGFFRQQPGARA